MTTSAHRLRWGILGCARISRRGLIPGIKGSATSVLHAIGSRNEATAKSWAEEFAIPKAYGSYEAVLADPEIEAVYIPLPNELHKPWTFAAADAGKHVLCEKPIGINAAEAAEMADYCKGRGVVLMEAFMWRHQPRVAGLRKHISDGAIGELRLVRSSFSFPIDADDWRLDPTRGGGALWDVGCYGVSTTRLFAESEPSSIKAHARRGPSGVDMSLTASLQFPGGVLGLVDCSFEQPFRCTYELVGTLGTLVVPDAYLPPEAPTALLTSSSEHLSSGGTRTLTFDGRDQYACMVDAFAQGIFDGKLPDPAEDGVAQMRVLDAILADAG